MLFYIVVLTAIWKDYLDFLTLERLKFLICPQDGANADFASELPLYWKACTLDSSLDSGKMGGVLEKKGKEIIHMSLHCYLTFYFQFVGLHQHQT